MGDIHELLAIPEGGEPPMNKAIEDCLAMSGLEIEDRVATLSAWLTLGAEYLAREVGRTRARAILQNTDAFVRYAQPSKPWAD